MRARKYKHSKPALLTLDRVNVFAADKIDAALCYCPSMSSMPWKKADNKPVCVVGRVNYAGGIAQRALIYTVVALVAMNNQSRSSKLRGATHTVCVMRRERAQQWRGFVGMRWRRNQVQWADMVVANGSRRGCCMTYTRRRGAMVHAELTERYYACRIIMLA